MIGNVNSTVNESFEGDLGCEFASKSEQRMQRGFVDQIVQLRDPGGPR